MKFLITGATGFVGQHVVNRLLPKHEVRILARRTSPVPQTWRGRVEICWGDLGDVASLGKAVAGVEVLINLATTMGGSREEVAQATIAGSRALFAAARQAGVRRLVHVSSMGVLPMGPAHRAAPLAESELYEAEAQYLSPYVEGKIAAEQAALQMLREGAMEVAVLRPGIVFGPGGSWKLSRLGTAAGPAFFLLGGGHQSLPVTYVENLADAIAVTALRPEPATGIFHILDEEPFSAREFIEGYRRKVRPGLRLVSLPRPVARLMGWGLGIVARRLKRINPLHAGHLDGCMLAYRYETVRTRDVLGWRPPIGKAEALARTYAAWGAKARPARRADLAKLGQAEPGVRRQRVALIGCGGIATQHREFLRDKPYAEVVACCDLQEGRAAEFAREQGIAHAYTRVEDLLTQEKPDAVHVLTPPQYTKELAIRCLRAGCHVLVEKPMALDAGEVGEMQRVAAETGRMLCVDHNHSYDAIMVEARRLVTTGAIGEVIWLDSFYGFDLRGNPGNPLLRADAANNWNYALPGGLFQNLLPHPLSVVAEFLPGPVEVKATARYFRLMPHQSADELRVMLTTPAAGALVTVSLAASPRFQTLRIHGTHGAIELDFTYKLLRWHGHAPGIPRSLHKLASNLRWGQRIIGRNLGMAWLHARKRWVHYDGMQRLIAEFHLAAQQGRPAPIPPEEALRVTQVMDETWRQIGPLRWSDNGSAN